MRQDKMGYDSRFSYSLRPTGQARWGAPLVNDYLLLPPYKLNNSKLQSFLIANNSQPIYKTDHEQRDYKTILATESNG